MIKRMVWIEIKESTGKGCFAIYIKNKIPFFNNQTGIQKTCV